jgi:hypothetical protein
MTCLYLRMTCLQDENQNRGQDVVLSLNIRGRKNIIKFTVN